MKPVAPTVSFAVRTARGEQRRIRSFLKQVTDLGVVVDDLPAESVRALHEAERFLGRYLAALAHETPTPEQLDGVIEALGGIDKVVKNAMQRKILECPDDNEWLEDAAKSPIDAIIGTGKVPNWVEIITGVPATNAKAAMTLNQIKHFAGLFWKLNFSEEGLPKESKANFTKLLEMIGMGEEQKKVASPAVSPSPEKPKE